MLIALTRAVPPTINECELTHLERQPIDVTRAAAQHAVYEETLRTLGCRVVHVAAAPDMPDSVFIEDTAIVLDEVAIITRPGAESRRGETEAVAEALKTMRRLEFIESPGEIDGGDVLTVGKTIFVGNSTRTNHEAIGQLRTIVAPFGYDVVEAAVPGALHLKTAITALDDDTLIADRRSVDTTPMSAFRIIDVPSEEPAAANVLRIGSHLLVAESAVRTAEMLRAMKYDVTTVPQDELAKAEAGLTCCSLIFSIDS